MKESELAIWVKLFEGNARFLAEALMTHGTLVIGADRAKDDDGEEYLGLAWEPLHTSIHSN